MRDGCLESVETIVERQYECDILRAADRNAVAGSAGTLRPLHDGVQSLQPLVSPRHLEAYLRPTGVEIARQSVSDRQHHCESSPRGERRKRGGEKSGDRYQ